MTNREQQAKRNREKYPDIAQAVDKVRRFDPGVKVEKVKPYKREGK